MARLFGQSQQEYSGVLAVNCRDSITVIVVAYHGARWLGPCLESLRHASQNRVRLCVVDNSGNGESIPADEPHFDYVVLRTPRPLGFADANNFALQELGVGDESVCFLNQDTISCAGWLDACQECFQAHPNVAALSPLLRTYDDSGWDPGFQDCARASSSLLSDMAQARSHTTFYQVPQVTAAAMIVRGEALRQSGPFDPIFGSYYEDYDLCRRIRVAGYQVGVCGTATVCHFSGSSTVSEQSRRKRMRQIIRNRAILRIREAGNHRLRELARYLVMTFPRSIGRSLFRTPSSQPLAIQLAAHWDLLYYWQRLAFEQRDREAWTAYLSRMGWSATPRTSPSSHSNLGTQVTK